LLKWLRALLSHNKTGSDFDQSLRFLLKGAHSDLELKNFGEARRRLLETLEYREQIKDRSLLVDVLNHLGATWWLQDQQHDEGTKFFSDYIRRYPEEAEAYSQRATILWYAGKPEEAVSDYSRALKSVPNDIFALSGRGQALVEIDNYNEALHDFERALRNLEQNPDLDSKWRKECQAIIQNGRAAAFAGLGDFDRALTEFDASLSACPHNAWTYYNRARAYDVRGERDKAIVDYRLALVKGEPRLSRSKMERAEARLRDLLAGEKNGRI
jgi:tetratricopeptide (TPR) repeat protein